MDNSTCSHVGHRFESLLDAEHECEKRRGCKGVLDIKCNGEKGFHICSNKFTEITDTEISSCVYEKYVIGTQISRSTIRVFLKLFCTFKFHGHLREVFIFYHYPDPCDTVNCNGTNVVCQIVFESGKAFCACEQGFSGDPNIGCGECKKYYIMAMWTDYKI